MGWFSFQRGDPSHILLGEVQSLRRRFPRIHSSDCCRGLPCFHYCPTTSIHHSFWGMVNILRKKFHIFAILLLHLLIIYDQTTFSCPFQVWIELTLLFGRIPSIGMFVFAFTNVFKKILMFFLVYLPALLAFSLSFYLLLSHHDTGVFSDPVSALIKTFVMMLGEIEYEGNFAWTVTKDQGAQVRTSIHIIPRPATISTIFL